MKITRYLLGVGFVLALAMTAMAQINYTTDTSLDLLVSSSNTFTVGDLTFSHFIAYGDPYGAVTVAPIDNGFNSGISFQSDWSLHGNGRQKSNIYFQYTVTCATGFELSLYGAELTISATTNNILNADANDSYTMNTYPGNAIYVGLFGADQTNVTQFAPQNNVTVQENFVMETSPSSTATTVVSVNSIDHIFLEAPEPSTFALLGCGLAGFALLRRKLVRNKTL